MCEQPEEIKLKNISIKSESCIHWFNDPHQLQAWCREQSELSSLETLVLVFSHRVFSRILVLDQSSDIQKYCVLLPEPCFQKEWTLFLNYWYRRSKELYLKAHEGDKTLIL